MSYTPTENDIELLRNAAMVLAGFQRGEICRQLSEFANRLIAEQVKSSACVL